jgi:hypothetical protein
MKRLWLLSILLICPTGVCAAGGPAPDFSGNWRLETKSSKVSGPEDGKLHLNVTDGRTVIKDPEDTIPKTLPEIPPAARLNNLTLRIIQTGNEVQIERRFSLDGKESTILQKFTLDGSQCINLSADGTGEFVSRSSLKNARLILTGIQMVRAQLGSAEAKVMEEYSLSKNGKKLTIKTTSIMPQGSIKLNQEFARQDNAKP